MWIVISFLFLLVATIVILLPFFKPANTLPADATVDAKLLSLFTKRDQLYQAIREAKFDLDTGKLSPEDYERQVLRLKQKAASVLKAIDRRQNDMASSRWEDWIEAQVRQERRVHAAVRPVATRSTVAATSSQARYCPKCGTRLNPGDRFCPVCGVNVAQ